MNNGYYIEREKEFKKSIDKLQGFNIENELYIGLKKHKHNFEKLQKSIKTKDFKLLHDIEENASHCEFGKLLEFFESTKEYKYILKFNLEEVINLHATWHLEFKKVKSILLSDNKKAIEDELKYIENLTLKITNIIDDILKSSLNVGKLTLDSGMKSMKQMTSILGTNQVQNSFNDTLEAFTRDIFDEFTWAIENIKIIYDANLDNSYDIAKTIRYNSKNANIYITLKEKDNTYLQEMINMLLEVLELHFIIKVREKSLVSFADKAQSANKSKDMFLANMSHELRTPLNAVNGFSQILMKKKDVPESVKKYIQKINIAGSNLLELVNTILDFAKLEAGKMQFNPKLTNISDVLTEVNTLIEPLANKKNIDYKMVNIVSLNLFMDAKLFKQVLINLLTNAIKFTDNGGKVELTLEFNYKRHVYIFKVKDSGIGISQDGISKLFQPFSQVDESYKRQEQGTGLGLMISKKIVEDLHNGKIWVESIEGEGSEFCVELPTPMVESKTYFIKEALESAKNVLIAEDSKEYQNILIENLKQTHNLTITDSVNKVKNLIKQNKYDYLILDFFLLDGISSEILQFMEEENINIQTIVMSAEEGINISSSLAGSSCLEGIMNKAHVEDICNMLISGIYNEKEKSII
jgi:signal transduction histidine kinase/ActR/RegA family two-component response regulator